MAITFRVRKAAEECGLSVRTLYRAMKSGKLASVQVGKCRLIPVRALEQFVLGSRGLDAPTPGTTQPRKGPPLRRRRVAAPERRAARRLRSRPAAAG